MFRGSIINFRTFFMEDDGKVFYRFGRNSICSVMTYDQFSVIFPRHDFLNKQFLEFKEKTIK